MNFSKFAFPLICLFLVAAFFWWFLTPSNLPGESVPPLSREHIKDNDPDPTYNSNPPTSGPHSEVWTPGGFYGSERNDRNLVHSLEHGYVIISYNCQIKEQRSEIRDTDQKSKIIVVKLPIFNFQFSINVQFLNFQKEVWAHEDRASPSAEATGSASDEVPGDEACHELKDYLKDLVKKLGVWKIIAVPRSNLEVRIALTAWGRIDKFNSSSSLGLSQSDKGRIDKFIKAFRDKGPEATKD